jgi:hypothetical protein
MHLFLLTTVLAFSVNLTANYRKSHRRDKQGHHKDEGDE